MLFLRSPLFVCFLTSFLLIFVLLPISAGAEQISIVRGNNNDTIAIELGDYLIDGGEGNDTLVLPLFPNEYTFTPTGPRSYIVTYLDYTLEIDNIEYVEFGSYTKTNLSTYIMPSGEVQDQLAKLTDLYLAFFGRAPDVSGLEYWQEQILTGKKDFVQISKDFAWSAEAQALYPQDGSNRDFVQKVYQNCFGRDPDAGGWDYWTEVLDGMGVTDLSDRGAFVGELLLGAYAPTSGEEDRNLLTNRHEVALYYVNRLSVNPEEGFDEAINNLLALVTEDALTRVNSIYIIDYAFQNRLSLSYILSDLILMAELWGEDIYSSLPKALNVSPTISGRPVTTILGGETEITDFAEGETTFPAAESDHLVLALNDEDKLEYIGLAEPLNASIELDADSTAASLVLLFPSIAAAYNYYPEEVKSVLFADPSVLALAEVISKTPDWSQMTDEELQGAYVNAVVSVMARLAQSLPVDAAVQQTTLSRQVYVPEEDTSEKSGITLSVRGQSEGGAIAPKFTFDIKNDFSRWVGIAIEKDGVVKQTFDLPSNKTIYPIFEEGIDAPDEEVIVYAIGPGLGGSYWDLSDYQKDLFLQAAIYSLFEEVVVPTVGVILSEGSCVVNMFKPRNLGQSQSFLDQVLASTELEDHIKTENYRDAGLELVLLGLKGVQSSAVSCLVGGVTQATVEMITRLLPVVGQIKGIMEAAEIAVKTGPFFASVDQSNNRERWEVKNSVKLKIEAEGVDYVPTAGYGTWGYTRAESIPSEWTDRYQGVCPGNDENKSCLGYTFEKDGPYEVNYEVTCLHPEDLYEVPCTSATYYHDGEAITSVNADEDGRVRFKHSYNEEKEYHGHLNVFDQYKALNAIEHEFFVQIKKAGPQVVIMENGNVLQSVVEGDTWRNTSPVQFSQWDEGGETITRTFKLVNGGAGTATIETAPTSSGNFTVTPDLSGTVIPPFGQIAFEITYKPVSSTDLEETLVFTGNLGVVDLPDLAGQISNQKDYDYSAIQLDVGWPTKSWSWSGMYPTEIGVTFSAGASISERPDGTYYGRFHFTPSDYYDGPAKIQGGSVEIVDRNIQNSSISSYCFYHDHYPPEAGPFPYTTNLVVYASFNVSEDTKLNIKISRELVSGEICREYLEQDGVFGVFDRMPLGTGFWEGSRNDFDISLNEGSNPLVDLQD